MHHRLVRLSVHSVSPDVNYVVVCRQQQKFRDVVEKVISIPTEVDTSNIDIKIHSDGSRRSYESESSSAIAVKGMPNMFALIDF